MKFDAPAGTNPIDQMKVVGKPTDRIDGPKKTMSLTDGAGSRIELGPNLLRITAATDLLIEAPGRAMRVRAKTVDFEEAP